MMSRRHGARCIDGKQKRSGISLPVSCPLSTELPICLPVRTGRSFPPRTGTKSFLQDLGGALFHSIITSSIQAASTPGEAFWHGGSLSFRIGTVLNDKAMMNREPFYTEQFLLHRCTYWNGSLLAFCQRSIWCCFRLKSYTDEIPGHEGLQLDAGTCVSRASQRKSK
jgi:hypothetical protein